MSWYSNSGKLANHSNPTFKFSSSCLRRCLDRREWSRDCMRLHSTAPLSSFRSMTSSSHPRFCLYLASSARLLTFSRSLSSLSCCVSSSSSSPSDARLCLRTRCLRPARLGRCVVSSRVALSPSTPPPVSSPVPPPSSTPSSSSPVLSSAAPLRTALSSVGALTLASRLPPEGSRACRIPASGNAPAKPRPDEQAGASAPDSPARRKWMLVERPSQSATCALCGGGGSGGGGGGEQG